MPPGKATCITDLAIAIGFAIAAHVSGAAFLTNCAYIALGASMAHLFIWKEW
jgi:hypothetical protein